MASEPKRLVQGRGFGAHITLGLALTLLGCGGCPSNDRAPSGTDPQEPPSVASEAALRARAETLWEARVEEDWETAFDFLYPEHQDQTNPQEYAEWCSEKEPFVWHEAEIGEVIVREPLGWVEVDCVTSMRRFPGAPEQPAVQWEKWLLRDNQWYPIPKTMIDSYPESPALRDAEAEARLSARVKAAWQARLDEQYGRLYREFVDPADRTYVSEDDYIAQFDLSEFLEYRVLFVEARNNRGRVRVAYQVKLTDPNMTKVPPKRSVINEKWIEREGKWYLELREGS